VCAHAASCFLHARAFTLNSTPTPVEEAVVDPAARGGAFQDGVIKRPRIRIEPRAGLLNTRNGGFERDFGNARVSRAASLQVHINQSPTNHTLSEADGRRARRWEWRAKRFIAFTAIQARFFYEHSISLLCAAYTICFEITLAPGLANGPRADPEHGLPVRLNLLRRLAPAVSSCLHFPTRSSKKYRDPPYPSLPSIR
jgi:hypothetical protein